MTYHAAVAAAALGSC
jgi:hypothetical protein